MRVTIQFPPHHFFLFFLPVSFPNKLDKNIHCINFICHAVKGNCNRRITGIYSTVRPLVTFHINPLRTTIDTDLAIISSGSSKAGAKST